MSFQRNRASVIPGCIVAILSYIIVVTSACGKKAPQETAKAETATERTSATQTALTPEQLRNAGIETAFPEKRVIGAALKASGFIETPPQSLVSVSFPLGGYLKQAKLLPGMRVKRGDILATLEDQQYVNLQQDYLTATTRLEYLTTELARQETLNRDQSSSDKALQSVRVEYKTQQINVKALAEKLRLIGLDPARLTPESITRSVHVYAPINAYVSAVKVNIGKYVAPTDVLFELVGADDLHLTLKIFEKDVAALRVGQKVRAYAAGAPDKEYEARISLIAQNVGEDRSIEAHCHFDKGAQGLLSGMFMSAAVETEKRSASVAPNDAIVRFENKHYVFAALSDTAFEMIEVEPGVSEQGYTAIEGARDLSAQKIVVKNAYALLMKMKNTEGE